MGSNDILNKALELSPDEKISVVDGVLKSLDEPSANLDKIWADESEKRLRAYRSGNLEGIPMEEVFKKA
ncbi:MAG: addiction module protein [Proteobacteria bacterium]|nr:addiction module protein [Pseudomonadota bacterium]